MRRNEEVEMNCITANMGISRKKILTQSNPPACEELIWDQDPRLSNF